MNSIERIQAAVTFCKPDRTPVIGQVFGHAAVINGQNLRSYVTSGVIAAECQLRALNQYGYDAVFALFDTCVEAEAAGCRLLYRENLYPAVQTHLLTPRSNLEAAAVPDPFQAGRMPEILAALRILRRETWGKTLVVGCVIGPMTLAAQLLDLETALFTAVDHPERFERVLDYAVEIISAFGRAQVEAGAHLPLVFDPAASPEVVPPAFFREFILPRYRRIFATLKNAGAVFNWLHIAGRVLPILPYYREMGVDIGNFDYCVHPVQAAEAAPLLCLDGNLKSATFITSEPQAIREESRQIIALFADRGGFILSSGCEIPPESNPDNITALVAAAREG